ncbi:Arrestin domain-containing protein 3 [Nibea albiflora]|uniref:Arrestin domain-containing protein 3 n=1 Tax=Nibea albiflora TaxID=240163 RepID=A0ACB7FCB7_NIBAL|nr:Arrestin domain-containing protein 3 [Nibea albiflora]
MASDIKEFTVVYNPINSSNTFTSGDYVTGQVTFELDKDCKINSLSVKLKGKAEVLWTEFHGQEIKSYHSKLKYFSIKEMIIQKGHGNNIVPRGSKVYPFSFRIPAGNLPPSFTGNHGMIVYALEANLSRSMKKDKKAKAYLTLVHNEDIRSNPVLMTPQCDVSVKKMLFTSGRVTMDVYIERMAFYQGESIKVVAAIQNKSTRDIRPKYCFYMTQSFFVKTKRKLLTQEIQREVGDVIPSSTSPTVIRILTIPPDMKPSILNCEIIRVEYKVKIYLDIKYALDPKIKFPIVILPALKAPEEEHHQPDYPVYGSGGSANSHMAGRTSFTPEEQHHQPAHPVYGLGRSANSHMPGRTSFTPEEQHHQPAYPVYGLGRSANSYMPGRTSFTPEEQHHQPAYPVYGLGRSANSYMPGRTSFLQNPTASGPSAPPSSYGTSGAYPSTNFSGNPRY